ncbi:DUF4012 domain-containing protein [Nocardioides sp.]|uniref:DUF4012 domain-containing protein n=1 Tax=Nocardioides sp. TaxID=35761 RepID=UPI003D0E41AD
MRFKRALLLVVLLALLVVGYAGWRVTQVRSDLQTASTSASRLQDALAAGDQQAAERELVLLRDSSASASYRTGGPLWSTLSAVPFLGDDAAAVRTASRALEALTRDGLTPLVRSSAGLEAGAFTPNNGTFPLAGVTALAKPVAAGATAFLAADELLAGVDTNGLVGPVRSPFEELATVVHESAGSLSSADRAIRLLPTMLGSQRARRYLLIFQNNAEVRASGGMPGAVAVLEADQGRVRMTRLATASDFRQLAEPILPLTEDEQEVFGDQLGVYFQDANFTPDFARTAALMAARWQQRYDERLDGVLSVDPVAMSYLLGATRPVTAGGIALSADTVVEELLNRTYLRLEDPAEQDAFFRDVAQQVFEALSSGTGSPQVLIEALARGASEGRLKVHSFDADEQQALGGTQVAGEFPGASVPASPRPQVGVFLNDATGSKMSYYLGYETRVASVSCTDDRQQLTGRLTMASRTPRGARSLPVSITGGGVHDIPPGSQLVATDVYGPVGGSMSHFVLDGRRLAVKQKEYDGRPVVSLALYLDPGQQVVVTWRMVTGPGQNGDVAVSVTPGVHPEDESSVSASACGADRS